MKCANRPCGQEFKEPRVVSGAGCCPSCSCRYYFSDDGVLQGPDTTWQYCQVCSLSFDVRAEQVYVDRKKTHELHACGGKRPCMAPDCTKNADKILTVSLLLLNGQTLILCPPGGGWAFCEYDALKATPHDLAGEIMANIPPVAIGGAVDPSKAELAVHDLDLYRPGGKFA